MLPPLNSSVAAHLFPAVSCQTILAMNKTGQATLVGAFVVGAVIILIGFFFFTGGLSRLREENERFVLVFDENVYGLHEGGKVTLNGVPVGRVERFFIGEAKEEESGSAVLVEINRKLVRRHMVEEGNELFDPEGNFRPAVLSRVKGQLVQESFVTGILYVNLEYDATLPETNATELYGYAQLGTRPSIFQKLSDSLKPEVLGERIHTLLDTANQRLAELDVISIKESFRSASLDFRSFIEQFSESFAPLGPGLADTSREAAASLAEFRKLSVSLNRMLDPTSDFRFGFGETLRETSAAMKSLKALAELLERNPQAILRGRGEEE